MFSNIFPFLCLLVIIPVKLLVSQSTTWLEHLSSNIKEEVHGHQVILLSVNCQKNENPRIGYIVRKIKRSFATLDYQFNDAKAKHQHHLQNSMKQLHDPQTSVFVIIHHTQINENLFDLSKAINFISEVSGLRPKCLIILLEQQISRNYKKVFQTMWSEQFLDVTLLEILILEQDKNHLFLNKHQENVTIQNFNPFTDSIIKEEYTSAVRLFPEKLRNLHSYPIRIGYYNFSPEVFETHDELGHSKLKGFTWQKMEVLSKKMNFRISLVPWTKKGSLNCTHKNESTGMFISLMKREVDFSTVEFGRYASCDEHFYAWSKGTTYIELCLFAPFIQEESYSLTFNWKILNLLAIISLPILVWCSSHLLLFDTRHWRMTYLMQIILGSSVPQEPQKLAERIIFITLLITCLLNSSFIFSAFTDIGLQRKFSTKYQTVEDLLSQNVETIVGSSIYSLLHPTSEGTEKLLLEKAKKLSGVHKLCAENLIKKKNLACLVSKSNMKWRLQGKRNKCGQPIAKTVDACFKKSPGFTVLASRSPYIKRVDTIVQRLIQSGISSKWMNEIIEKPANTVDSCKAEKEESVQILQQIFFVLIFGYSCSTLTFICELLAVCLLKYKAKHFKVAQYLHTRR